MRETLFYILSSFWIGAVHAATPGHGKTIAAAYIVGARGRPIDALILGVFVTLSHTTGIVLVGVLASLGSVWLVPQRVEAYLALATGLLVVGLGVWMLWTQRDLLALPIGDPSIAQREDGSGADEDADLRDAEPQRQPVERDQEREEIDIAHAKWPGDVERSRRAGAGSRHGRGVGCEAGFHAAILPRSLGVHRPIAAWSRKRHPVAMESQGGAER
jgi:ABC-type nickel/cobalt efflux system permease component RcnA